ncbi:Queuine tRNA-ribosyltransferase subunit qtrtd1 [Entomortierella chlamydospora]|uniref:Queuine tRNA-ribosyltransferase accessory subunit 2 n=1 Tax=Entomortierella chlamydospora TaxID=101097 RepID=A0A9P6T2G2_9FUNG|nr:Queuine tRNA-ribosyltransferase subunit qtrtd1 [Entomortierella chlamydospora]KAG0020086.1 Queuine tRNA-ribosyltransferase subunit qtrtd1 [Entomortierella chlamydospora]
MSPIKFEIHSSIREPNSNARTGTLSIVKASQPDQDAVKRVIETPGCFMFSIKGSVPHLTPDNMRLQDFGGVNVSLEQLLQMDQPASFASKWPSKSFTLADYLYLKDLILLCDMRDYSSLSSSLTPKTSQQDPHTQRISPNTDRHVNLSTLRGARPLTLDDYLSVVRQFRPDIMVALADNIVESSSRNNESKTEVDVKKEKNDGSRGKADEKRIRKSIDRTLKWLDQILLERQGRDGRIEDRRIEEEKKRKKEKEKIRQARKQEHGQQEQQGEEEVPVEIPEIETEPWEDVALFAHVQGGQFEEERIRSAEETSKREGVNGFIIDLGVYSNGDNSKEERLAHLKTSVDHLPAQKPRMVYGIQTPEDVLKVVALGVDLFDTSYPFILTEEGKASMYSFGPNSTSDETNNNNRWINLWDDEHGDKFVPILESCECYSCKGGKHTRAYINHLLKTHEMLATVLLMSHNLYQYSKFFSAVREAIKTGTLDQYTQDFERQFGVEPVRTGEKHKAQIVVEEALTKRNQRLEPTEPAVVDAIGSGDGDGQSFKRPDDDGGENEKEKKKQKKDSSEQSNP